MTTCIKDGSPSFCQVGESFKKFYPGKSHLTVVDGVIVYNMCAGHLDEVKRIEQARQVLWWPGLTEDINLVVRPCRVSKKF